MKVVGIDLSGPGNLADTYLVLLEERGTELHWVADLAGADDQTIFRIISDQGKNERIVIGMDAPLSYNPGGGDRASDQELRQLVSKKGRVGIMPPTMIRMVHLTLRGIVLARMLETLKPDSDLHILEVHPGASMLLRGAPAGQVAIFKRDRLARSQLLQWLETQGLKGISRTEEVADHYVAACAAALGAWQWSLGRAAWVFPASPPDHPYDFAC
jgi:predicted nuclease with RNAse H fold